MNITKPSILILDDFQNELDLIEHILNKANYQAIATNNSKDFFEQLNNHEVDLILLDVVMPETSGFEICKQLKSEPASKNIPVIFLTSLKKEKYIIEGLKSGADDFINKPFNEHILLLRVNKVLTLYKQKDEYNDLFNKMNVAACLLEAVYNNENKLVDIRYLNLNSAYEKLLGMPKNKIIENTTLELMPLTEQAWLDKFSSMLENGKAIHFEKYHEPTKKFYEVKSYIVSPNKFATILNDITEKKKSDLELKLKNEELGIIFRSLPISHMLINEKNEVIKLNHSGHLGNTGNKALKPGYVLKCENIFKNNIDCGKGEACNYCIIKQTVNDTFKTGKSCIKVNGKIKINDDSNLTKTKYIQISSTLINNQYEKQVLLSIDDVSKEKKLEFKLREREEKYKMLFENMSDAFALHKLVKSNDKNYDFEYKEVNSSFLELFGLDKAVVYKNRLSELFPNVSKEILEKYKKVALNGKSIQFTEYISNLDKYFEISIYCPKPGYIASILTDITEKTKTVLALKKSEENYRLIMENISDVVWRYDLNLTPLFITPSVYKLRGYTVNETLNQPVTDFAPTESLKLAQKLIDEKIEQKKKGDIRCWEPFNIKLKLLKKDKSTFWANLTAKLVRGADGEIKEIIGITRDINIEEEAKKALTESEKRYRTLFEKSKDPIVIVSKKGYIDCNQATLTALKCNFKEDFLFKQPWDFSPEFQPDGQCSKDKAIKMVEIGLNSGINSFEWVHEDIKGNLIWFHISMTSITLKNQKMLYCIWRDINLEKKAEKELYEAKNKQEALNVELQAINDELFEQKERLEKTKDKLIQSEKMASLGILTAGIAHEINNPLNFISTGTMGLQKCVEGLIKKLQGFQKLDEKNLFKDFKEYKLNHENEIEKTIKVSRKMVKNIEIGIDKAADIVKSMKTFSQNNERDFTANKLNQLIDSVLVILHNSYKYKLEIIKDYCDDDTIICISGRLHQAFMNLIGNAIHATPQDGKIFINTYWDNLGNNLIVSIKDTGHGIPKEIQTKIFDPFFTTKDVGEGTGLGLYITYHIIEQHHGEIKFQTDEHGTEFLISLPKSRE